MQPVRRTSDDELCGFVEGRDGRWAALTVFGAELGRHDRQDDAIAQVLADGLSALAERWSLREGASGDEEIVCIQEANPAGVTVARGYYSMPGVPTLRITREQLDAGEWMLTR